MRLVYGKEVPVLNSALLHFSFLRFLESMIRCVPILDLDKAIDTVNLTC